MKNGFRVMTTSDEAFSLDWQLCVLLATDRFSPQSVAGAIVSGLLSERSYGIYCIYFSESLYDPGPLDEPHFPKWPHFSKRVIYPLHLLPCRGS